jgi:hypothetical protein
VEIYTLKHLKLRGTVSQSQSTGPCCTKYPQLSADDRLINLFYLSASEVKSKQVDHLAFEEMPREKKPDLAYKSTHACTKH